MAENEPTYEFETQAVHAGAEPDPATNARITPIYQTASYVFNDAQHAANLFGLQEFGNIYTRIMNPTNDVLEKRVAALEGGAAALAVASGHAAQLIAFHTIMESGCNIVAANRLYGGSINQLGQSFKKMNWHTKFVDQDDVQAISDAIDEKTRCVFVESLANPGGIVTDIAAIAEAAHAKGVPLIVDNTLASPYLCQPLKHGADIVVQSLTKFLGGQGNSIGGIIVDGASFDWAASDKFPALSQPNDSYHGMVMSQAFGPLAFILACRTLGLRDLGPALAPMNAFLILNGIETLALRMQRHCENAMQVAQWLQDHEQVDWVSYAGLPGDRYHALAQTYLPKGAGAVFTFGLKGGYDAGVKLVDSVKLFSHLANVGDTRSLIIHPASTTHSQLDEAARIKAGAGSDVVRLSVGIENADDLIADLAQALS